MKNPEEPKRDFNKPSSIMLNQAEGMHDSLVTDIADFTAEYPDISPAFLIAFMAKIVAAKAAIRDHEVKTDISLLVAEMETLMSDGRDIYMKVIQYAKLAYPHNQAMLNTFGHKDYEAYSYVQYLLPIILDQAYRRASDAVIKPLLIAKGFSLAQITSIDTISGDIKEKFKDLYNEKNGRLPTTQDRVTLENAVWADMSEISLCSKDVYSDNWAKRHTYLLYAEGEPEVTPPVPPVPPVV